MKKIAFTIGLCLSMLLTAYPAMIIFRWNPVYAPAVNDLPATHVKLYYGNKLNIYTNSVTVPITNLVVEPYLGYDQYGCAMVYVSNYVNIVITNLVLGQKIFTAYSVKNVGGVESPLIGEATCEFIVTNNSNGIIASPKNLQTLP